MAEARDRVAKARVLLSRWGLGREPTGDEILNTALRERVVVLGVANSPRGERDVRGEACGRESRGGIGGAEGRSGSTDAEGKVGCGVALAGPQAEAEAGALGSAKVPGSWSSPSRSGPRSAPGQALRTLAGP